MDWLFNLLNFFFKKENKSVITSVMKKSYPKIEFGSQDKETVIIWQKYLISQGKKVLDDGIFGVNTKRNTQAIQKENNLLDDGIVGKNTWKLLTAKQDFTPPTNAENNSVKQIIDAVLNVFENGRITRVYDEIYIFSDGTNNIKQVTLGKGFTECGGALWKVIEKYNQLGGKHKAELLNYKYLSCMGILPDNKDFINLLKFMGRETVGIIAQDYVYEKLYYLRGENWAKANGFVLPLSMLVIQDSMLHSGSMLSFLINRFSAKTPRGGGEEKEWIRQYLKARDIWLRNHSRIILRNTVYRTEFLQKQINSNNWNLSQFPLYVNGVKISDSFPT